MAMTFSSMTNQNFFSQSATFGLFALDNNYVTGGYVIRPKDVQLKSIAKIVPVGNPGGYSYIWDAATSKLLVYGGSQHVHTNSRYLNSSALFESRLYLSAVVGVPAPADVVTGAAGSATVVSYTAGANPYVVVNGIVGNFVDGEALTFPPGAATANAVGVTVDAWTFIPDMGATACITSCQVNTGALLNQKPGLIANTLVANSYRFNGTYGIIETLNADGWTTVQVQGINATNATNSAGGIGTEVPNATNLAAITNCQFIAIGN